MSAKVNINPPLPSEKIIASQQVQLKAEVIDSQGRVLKLRMPDALDEFDLNSALGDDASNVGCAAMAQTLLYVESINGEPFLMPRSYAQVRASIQKIGTNGMRAIVEAITEFAKEQNELSEQQQVNAIKK